MKYAKWVYVLGGLLAAWGALGMRSPLRVNEAAAAQVEVDPRAPSPEPLFPGPLVMRDAGRDASN